MPENSVQSKVEATQGLRRAPSSRPGVTAATRDTVAREIAEKNGASVIPPFDDERIIAGAGTVGLEIVEEWPEVTTIVTPLGGGGLLSGTALAATSVNPAIDVYGVEPAAGNDGEQSFHSGRIVTIDPPKTIADGARTLAIGERNFAIIRERVKNVVSVDDDAPARDAQVGHVPHQARHRADRRPRPRRPDRPARSKPRGPVAVVISGGNLDFSLLC